MRAQEHRVGSATCFEVLVSYAPGVPARELKSEETQIPQQGSGLLLVMWGLYYRKIDHLNIFFKLFLPFLTRNLSSESPENENA